MKVIYERILPYQRLLRTAGGESHTSTINILNNAPTVISCIGLQFVGYIPFIQVVKSLGSLIQTLKVSNIDYAQRDM